MLSFIIPLKSQKVSSDWEQTCKLLERTLKSLFNQVSSDYRVIVVCHEKPIVALEAPNIHYVELDFPAPERKDLDNLRNDKYRKLSVGLAYSKELSASHVMFVDADDLISNRLAYFVSQHPKSNGWFLDKGYQYLEDEKILKIRSRNFYQRCGTCFIIRLALLEQDICPSPEQMDWRHSILHHVATLPMLKSRGIVLPPLPFAGVIAIVNNGENIWWNKKGLSPRIKDIGIKEVLPSYLRKLYQPFITRPLSPSIQSEFAFYKILRN
jgi:glycosyltransferase involved in cell wall biosynthesis